MDIYSFLSEIFTLGKPWYVGEVVHLEESWTIEIHIFHEAQAKLPCPKCGTLCGIHDHRTRRWRHLPLWQYDTLVVCEVPRVHCREHGVLTVQVPWAEDGSRFTALFEGFVIEILKEASISGAARLLHLSWDQVDGIVKRAVQRGLARRRSVPPRRIGVDETSFQKGHRYVTIVTDLDRGIVLYVGKGRKEETLDSFWETLPSQARAEIEVVAMDMWMPYIQSTGAHVPGAEDKIVFDRFHVIQHLGKAVDRVRKEEHRKFLQRGREDLKGTKYLWLRSPSSMSRGEKADFAKIRDVATRVARAWAIKEGARTLWSYRSRGWAKRAWKRWYLWAIRSKLEPIKKVARMVLKHLIGILNASVLGITNAKAEGMNAIVQKLKGRAFGYRNLDRFIHAIYFHKGGLDMLPVSARPHRKP